MSEENVDPPKSVKSKHGVKLRITNESGTEVRLYWYNYKGTAKA